MKVIFNEESRAEWLTGFRKRKILRRKYGIAMQILKDKKVVKDKAKERRVSKKNDDDSQVSDDDAEAEDDEIVQSNRSPGGWSQSNDSMKSDDDDDTQSIIYNDEQTQNMFGSTVLVDIDTNIADKLDPWKRASDSQSVSGESIASRASNRSGRSSSYHSNNYQDEFLKAIKKAKQIMGQKKSKKRKEKNGLKLKAKLKGNSNQGYGSKKSK